MNADPLDDLAAAVHTPPLPRARRIAPRPKSSSSPLVWLAIGGGCLFVFLILLASIALQRPASSTPRPAVPVAEVNAVQLMEQYRENELAADGIYRGRRYRINGTVRSITRDVKEDAHVRLCGPNLLADVDCVFEGQPSELAELNPGQRVTIDGTISGMTLGSVFAHRCDLVAR